ncbi:MAG: DEAD/DEAH box helicase [Alphaproteobacteria bacterium]|nr:DEAD/DEAH box helicase [Alphaproteobacteria bacterium]
MSGFDRMGLHPSILKALSQMGFDKPTPIQEKAIPPALMGQDVLGSAQTGTGKTAAFSIPMVQYLLLNPARNALVLTPTRELAQQVNEVVRSLTATNRGMNTALLIGGMDMKAQVSELRNRPRIIVGTPGRIIDHLEQGSLFLGATEFLVLDETDRMLDMGFGIQLAKVRKFLKSGRQTLLFSATLPSNIKELASNYLNNPVRIAVGGNSQPIEKIKQTIIKTDGKSKMRVLQEELKKREGTIIIFCRTKSGTDNLSELLNKQGFESRAIHGDLSQAQREMVLEDYRESKFRILVATDVASRGLDISHITLVVNYELPQAPEDYIHRIGRTGRAGAEGEALCLITPEDAEQWRLINRLIDSSAARPAGEDAPAPATPNAPHSHKKRRGGANRNRSGNPQNKPSGIQKSAKPKVSSKPS